MSKLRALIKRINTLTELSNKINAELVDLRFDVLDLINSEELDTPKPSIEVTPVESNSIIETSPIEPKRLNINANINTMLVQNIKRKVLVQKGIMLSSKTYTKFETVLKQFVHDIQNNQPTILTKKSKNVDFRDVFEDQELVEAFDTLAFYMLSSFKHKKRKHIVDELNEIFGISTGTANQLYERTDSFLEVNSVKGLSL